MMKKLMCLLLSVLVLLCACPALGEEAAPEATAEAAAEQPLTFDVAAHFRTLCDLDLTPYYGKAIALVFFNAASEAQTPMLPTWKMVWDDFNKDQLQIVLIHVGDGEGQEEMDALKAELGLEEMTIYEDVDATLTKELGIKQENLPNVLILNKDGNPASGYAGRIGYPSLQEFFALMEVEQLQNSWQATQEAAQEAAAE